MPGRSRRRVGGCLATLTGVCAVGALVAGTVVPGPVAAAASGGSVVDPTLARSPELSETSRLADRRFVVTGERAWEMGSADGRYPATGFHTRGEMGGFWTPSMKMLDGMWFGIDDDWIGHGTQTTSGWGYVRTDLPTTAGIAASRTDFVPDTVGGVVVGLSLRSGTARTVSLKVDAHSELMSAYPWGETTPSQTTQNLPDTAAFSGGQLLFRDKGRNASGRHDWAAAVGSSLRPTGSSTGSNFRGPQSGDVVCPASGPNTPTQPARCDDTAYGHGAGGQLRYRVRLKPGRVTTVWFAVGGSQDGPGAARRELAAALHHPARALAAKIAARRQVQASSRADLPGAPLIEQSVAWTKQMLAASVQQSEDVKLRAVHAGTAYPKPVATLPSMRWIGAGWPDYTWLFGTDGEYTAYAAVAAGQFGAIEDHLRALRDVSDAVNHRSGKIVHEVTPNGAVYFGANADAGDTDETVKFPSTVALVWRWTGDKRFLAEMYPASVRAMRYLSKVDVDHDGWPEGQGNVETPGMGPEKLDVAVYTIRGYADLADLAEARGDTKTQRWATARATSLLAKFEHDWWYGKDGARSYADSLQADNTKTFQRHWIGLTPTEAVLPALPGRAAAPLATQQHGTTTLAQHETACYNGPLGLWHTGTGGTSASAGNPGPSCDTATSSIPSLRDSFTLNSAIAAVGEGNFGRLGATQQQFYLDGVAKAQLDPSLWEMPGAMPEIVPGGDFGANIDKLFTERSMVMQAWGAYGILWPVVHQWLGVSPDLGRNRVAVVPQLPPDQERASLSDVKLGSRRSIDVSARHTGTTYRTTVSRHGRIGLTIGAVLPRSARVVRATLNGRHVDLITTTTSRGLEATLELPVGRGTSKLVIVTS